MDSQTHNVPCEYPHNACPSYGLVFRCQSVSLESSCLYSFKQVATVWCPDPGQRRRFFRIPTRARIPDGYRSSHPVLPIVSLVCLYHLHIHHSDTMLITPAILALPLLASAVPTAREQLAFQVSTGSAIIEGQDIFAAHDGFSLDLGEMRLVQFSEEEPAV